MEHKIAESWVGRSRRCLPERRVSQHELSLLRVSTILYDTLCSVHYLLSLALRKCAKSRCRLVNALSLGRMTSEQ